MTKRTCVTKYCLSKKPDFLTSEVLPAIWGVSRQRSVTPSPHTLADPFLFSLVVVVGPTPTTGWKLATEIVSLHISMVSTYEGRKSVWKWTLDIYPVTSLSGAADRPLLPTHIRCSLCEFPLPATTTKLLFSEGKIKLFQVNEYAFFLAPILWVLYICSTCCVHCVYACMVWVWRGLINILCIFSYIMQ